MEDQRTLRYVGRDHRRQRERRREKREGGPRRKRNDANQHTLWPLCTFHPDLEMRLRYIVLRQLKYSDTRVLPVCYLYKNIFLNLVQSRHSQMILLNSFLQLMTAEQVMAEKYSIQKSLLQFEKKYGRPVSEYCVHNVVYITCTAIHSVYMYIWARCSKELFNVSYEARKGRTNLRMRLPHNIFICSLKPVNPSTRCCTRNDSLATPAWLC